jgi:SNF2 family DNA or RNA helicase
LGLLPGRTDTSSSKVDRLVEALSELAGEGHKALVFSQWTSLLDRIEPHLEAANLGFVRLDGQTRDRESVVNAFQDPGGPPVMLL